MGPVMLLLVGLTLVDNQINFTVNFVNPSVSGGQLGQMSVIR